MPRIRQLADKYAREDFYKEIKRKQGEEELPSVRALAEATDIPASTLSDKMRTPDDLDGLTVRQLRQIVKVLEPSEDIILRFVGVRRKRQTNLQRRTTI